MSKYVVKIFSLMTIILLTGLILSGGLYLVHFNYVEELAQRHVPDVENYKKYKTLKLIERVGYLKLPPRKLSFLNYRQTSKEKIRVGVFGDSYTFGAEVPGSQSYPALLQSILGEEYEVINFGMNWFSLDQSYILFDHFYDQMELDYVVLGPRGLYRYRTASFNHTNDKEPYYIHSRFVLDSQKRLKELRPIGADFKERFEKYYRFLPLKQYLLYDTRAPSFLRSLEYFLGLRFVNPFYHQRNVNSEVEEVHSEILKQFMLKAKERFLFLHNRFEEDRLAKNFSWNKSSHKKLEDLRWKGFPWFAPRGHFSGFGNALVAAEVAFFVTGSRPNTPSFKILGKYNKWDDGDIKVFYEGEAIGGLSGESSKASHMVGLNCVGQNVGNTLFYPVSNAPKEPVQMDGLKKVYSGQWLTVYTGKRCFIDYQRKELLLEEGQGDRVMLDDIVLAEKVSEQNIAGREMVVYAPRVGPERIVLEDTKAGEMFAARKIELEIR